ncbi:MAG: HDOD domain-containing protein [Ilumatobacteraceae bacterium]|nr:HDOD domain-containing protein [Acidimicrobiales bacterium]
MIKVLVVDHELDALVTLERQLSHQRAEWELEFRSDELTADHLGLGWDVVVADTAARAADGQPLLALAKSAAPSAVRIALSADAAALATLTMAHQVLPRRCDAGLLRLTVRRSVDLRARLADPKVLEVLGAMPSLPSPSSAMLELQQALDAASIDLHRVSRVVSSDVGMTAKLLQIINSSFYGLSRTVEDPAEAVRLLGPNLVGEILLTVGLLDAVAGRSPEVEDQLRSMRDRSLARADLAANLADLAGRAPALVRRVWNATFLVDVGRMLLVGTDFEHDPEVERLHAVLGGALLAIWGLPPNLVEAVALSDQAPESTTPETVLYGWIANAFLVGNDAIERAAIADGEVAATAGAPVVDDEMLAAVVRWTGLSKADLSAYRRSPVPT